MTNNNKLPLDKRQNTVLFPPRSNLTDSHFAGSFKLKCLLMGNSQVQQCKSYFDKL